jgi:hypothetical protein
MDNLQPMIALNIYLLPGFRQEILDEVLSGLSSLPEEDRREVMSSVRENVKISGFRNPFSAPKAVLMRRMEAVFFKQSRFAKSMLKAWAAGQEPLQNPVKAVIDTLNFQPNPQAPDYPDPENAFLTGWPEKTSYQKIADLIRAQEPSLNASTDTLALMTVWLSGCLPDPISAGETA